MKFLVWQTAFLGDVILATPIVRSLERNYPDAEIAFVGRPFIRDLFRGWDIELIPFSKGFGESFSILKRIKDSDVAIVPHRSLRTALTMLFSGIPTRIGFDRSEFRYAYTHLVEHRWELHDVDRNLELLKPLGVEKVTRETYLPIEEGEVEEALGKFGLREKEYVVLNPFSNFPLKEWDIDNWAELMKKLEGFEKVVTGLPSDREKAKRLRERVEFRDLVGKTTLRELMAVVRGAKLVISNDSSPVHIANALGVPAITIYTATSPAYGFYPLKGSYVENPAPCSPCSPNPKRCRTGSYECLKLPTPDSLLKVLNKFL